MFTLTKAFNILPLRDNQKGLSTLLLMVIVYIYKGIINLNAQIAMLMVKFCQPSHEFTFGVGMSFIPYPLVLTPVV
jgi:hypothetical protein